MSEQWIDTEFSDKAPTLDALEAQLGGESWSSRIQRDPLFAAQLAVVDCSDEVVKRTEHYEARIAELERRNALLTAFVETVENTTAVFPILEQGERFHAAWRTLTEDGFPWSDDQ